MFITLIFIVCFLDSLDAVGIQCVDENGTTVDWQILYKLPNTLFNGTSKNNSAKNRLAVNKNEAQTNGTNTVKGKGTNTVNGTNAEKPFNGTPKNLLQSGQVSIPVLTGFTFLACFTSLFDSSKLY